MLFRLSGEEKAIGIGGLAVVLGVFMPWYTVVMNFDKEVTESGFSGDLGILGFVVFLLMLLVLGFLMGDHLHFRLPRFGLKKENILLFLSGESAFLLLLALAIFTKRSLDFTNAELRFGLYMALIGAVLSAFAAFAQIQKLQKKETKEFFEHEEQLEEEALPAEDEGAFEEETPKKGHPAKTHHHHKEEKADQALFFAEEERGAEAFVQSDLAGNEPMVEETVREELEIRAEAPAEESVDPAEIFAQPSEPQAEEEKKEAINRDMGFYNDL